MIKFTLTKEQRKFFDATGNLQLHARATIDGFYFDSVIEHEQIKTDSLRPGNIVCFNSVDWSEMTHPLSDNYYKQARFLIFYPSMIKGEEICFHFVNETIYQNIKNFNK